MLLLPIQKTLSENAHFQTDAALEAALAMTVGYFDQIGYDPPWIGYFVQLNDTLVGSAAFKGKPKNGRVEMAYGTFDPYQQQGIGTAICRQLVLLAQTTDPTVTITARTLPEESYSTRILRKNGFFCVGDVWEWEYQPGRSQ